MFDIGIGEILIVGIIGLLVFGPDRLPRAAADAAKWIKQMKAMATGARKDLADSAGIDLGDTVSSLRDLHPRRLAASFLKDDDDNQPEPTKAQRGAWAAPTTFDPDAT